MLAPAKGRPSGSTTRPRNTIASAGSPPARPSTSRGIHRDRGGAQRAERQPECRQEDEPPRPHPPDPRASRLDMPCGIEQGRDPTVQLRRPFGQGEAPAYRPRGTPALDLAQPSRASAYAVAVGTARGGIGEQFLVETDPASSHQ